jgi:hypothetical protein
MVRDLALGYGEQSRRTLALRGLQSLAKVTRQRASLAKHLASYFCTVLASASCPERSSTEPKHVCIDLGELDRNSFTDADFGLAKHLASEGGWRAILT